jgi:hypothetical protein
MTAARIEIEIAIRTMPLAHVMRLAAWAIEQREAPPAAATFGDEEATTKGKR